MELAERSDHVRRPAPGAQHVVPEVAAEANDPPPALAGRAMHVIPLISMPYTGTVTTREFFASLARPVNLVPLEAAQKTLYLLGTETTPGLDPLVVNLVWGNLTDATEGLAQTLASWWTPICPLRDPLAALVTERERKPDADLVPRVGEWCTLMRFVDRYEAFCFPVDLPMAIWERVEAIRGLLRATALAWPPDIVEELNRWAKDWPVHNTRGAYKLKARYQAGDLGALRAAGLDTAITALQAQEGTLRPWLEKAGYRWLPWWSGDPPKERLA